MNELNETEEVKRKAEEDLMSARFWLKEARQFGGELSRFKRAGADQVSPELIKFASQR